MADPNVGATDSQRRISQELFFYSASRSDFINDILSPTTMAKEGTVSLKRFRKLHHFDNNKLYHKKLSIYQCLPSVSYTNRMTHIITRIHIVC